MTHVPPTHTTRLLKWTVETDYALEIDDPRSDEEIVAELLDGAFDTLPLEPVASRISQHYGVVLDEVRKWGH